MTKTIFSERNTSTFYVGIIICDHSVYTMDHPKFIASNQKKEYIGTQKIKHAHFSPDLMQEQTEDEDNRTQLYLIGTELINGCL